MEGKKASSLLIPPPSEIDLEAGGGEDQLQCRICLETDERDFIAPCKCKGTSKYVHRDCFDQAGPAARGLAEERRVRRRTLVGALTTHVLSTTSSEGTATRRPSNKESICYTGNLFPQKYQ